MKILIICPVRNGTPKGVINYVANLEMQGQQVYLPPRDTPQDDPTGLDICLRTKHQIQQADEVHIWYDNSSQGIHFDMGMAFMLGKKWKLINTPIDEKTKSYIKVIKQTESK